MRARLALTLLAACLLGVAGVACTMSGWRTWDAFDRMDSRYGAADAVLPDPLGGLAPVSLTALEEHGRVDRASAYFLAGGQIHRKGERTGVSQACQPGNQVNPGTPDVEQGLGDCIGMGSVVAVVHHDAVGAAELERPARLQGRLPEKIREVAVGATFARDRGVGVGDRLSLHFLPAWVAEAIRQGALPGNEHTEVHEFDVVGVYTMPSDLRPPLGGGFRSVLLPSAFDDAHRDTLMYYPVFMVDLRPGGKVLDLRRALAKARPHVADERLKALSAQKAKMPPAPSGAGEASGHAPGEAQSIPAMEQPEDPQKALAQMAGAPSLIYDKAHQKVRVERFHRHLAWQAIAAGVLLLAASLLMFAKAVRDAHARTRVVDGWAVALAVTTASGGLWAAPHLPLASSVRDLGRAGVLRPSVGAGLLSAVVLALAYWLAGHRRPETSEPYGPVWRSSTAAGLGIVVALALASSAALGQWRLEGSVRDPLDYGAPWTFHLGYTFVGDVKPEHLEFITAAPGVREISNGTLVDLEACAGGGSTVIPFFALDRVRGDLLPTVLSAKAPETDAPVGMREQVDAPAAWPCGGSRPAGWEPLPCKDLPQILLGVGAAEELGVPDAEGCRVVYLTDSAERRLPVAVVGIGSFPSLGETGWHGRVGFVGHRELREAVFPGLAKNFALVNVDPRLRRQFVHQVIATLRFGVPPESTTAPPPERLAAANTRREETVLSLAALLFAGLVAWLGAARWPALLLPGVAVGMGVAEVMWRLQRVADGLDPGYSSTWRFLGQFVLAMVGLSLLTAAVLRARDEAAAARASGQSEGVGTCLPL